MPVFTLPLVKLLSVRLGPEDARLATELRKAGVQLSRVVREALRAAHAERGAIPARETPIGGRRSSLYAATSEAPEVRDGA